MSDVQMGYRKGRGTTDAIYIVKTAIEEEIKKEKGEIFLFFVDMKGAFERIKRKKIWQIMGEKRNKLNFRREIEEIHEETYFKITTNEEISIKIATKTGMRQGCRVSTSLFNQER